jgi:hypothetical protein
MRLGKILLIAAILPQFAWAQVSSNVTVSVVGNTEVHVFEDVTNSGDFDISANALFHVRGDIALSGSSQQNLGGHVIVDKLHQDNAAGVIVEAGSQVEVFEALELNAGQMTANAPVIMKSLPAWTAYVDDFSSGFNGSYSGNLTMERFIASSGFHHMGGAVDVSNIASELSEASLYGSNMGQVIPLPTCSPTAIDGSSPYGNMFEWHENAPFLFSCAQSGWFVRSSGTMVNGRGYSLIKAANTNFELTGSPHLSPVAYNSLTNSGGVGNGFHLVSNPYPSDIEWMSVPGFGIAAYIWQSTGSYAGTYQAALGGAGTRIASQQAFFVQQAGGVNFSIPLSSRRTGSATYFRQASNEGLEIIVKGYGFADRSLVNFDIEATPEYDINRDAMKLRHTNGQPLLATTNGIDDFSINTVNLEEISEIPLVFTSATFGSYTFEFDTEEAGFWLEDRKTGYYNPLGSIYAFNWEDGDQEDRFIIHHRLSDDAITTKPMAMYVNNQELFISNVDGPAQINLYDMAGKMIWNGNRLMSEGVNVVQLPSVATGAYVISVTTDKSAKTLKAVIR